jgi:hypothetical protein
MNLQKLVLVFVVGLLWSRPALAYVDPVSGAMLLQVLFSGIAGAGVVFRRVIGNFFRRLKARWKSEPHE